MPELLLPEQERTLEKLATEHTDAAVRQRAKLLLMYQAGKPTADIASSVDLSARSVRRWRRRFLEEGMSIFPDGVLLADEATAAPDLTATSGDGLANPATAAATEPHEDAPEADEVPPPTPPPAELEALTQRTEYDLNDPAIFVNRELSMLEFQRRVLAEAQDATVPLLERVKFVGIVGSNLDEFFMVRVGGLKMQQASGVVDRSPDGLTPAQQLTAIRPAAHELMQEARHTLQDDLLPRLREEGIYLLHHDELNAAQRDQVRRYFEEVVFPILTPMAFGPGHPFPHISNLSLNLAVLVRDEYGQEHFARVKVPRSIPRLLPIDGEEDKTYCFVWMEEVIAANLGALFPGLEIVESYFFRVTRNAEMAIQELEADDLLETMEQSVRQRRFGAVVRVTVNATMPEDVREILMENLGLDATDLYALDGPLGLSSLWDLYDQIERYDLRDTRFLPATPEPLRKEVREGSFFSAIRRQNILIHRPYDSFVPVIDFLEIAANDPKVLAIKQTLYRVGSNSPVVKALLKARENGKQVTALVELKARFDEESNITWAKTLEQEGVHVVYGLLGLKTHSKVALVVRKEGERIRRYVHLSTGNYNAVTARLYEDIGFFTVDDQIGEDATHLFNYLTGYSAKRDYRKLLVAPINLRDRIHALIERETEHARAGCAARLILKTNALVDKKLIKQLYAASQAGVEIDLIVRGICCLRPGIDGLSENIRVRSIVGRFLEHSRIYYFHNDGAEEIYLGSADLMPRNLDRRVETLFPVEDEPLIRRLRDDVLETYLHDNVKARRMQADGTYTRVEPADGEEALNAQEAFLSQRT